MNATMPVSGGKVRSEVSTGSEQLDQTSDALGGRPLAPPEEELISFSATCTARERKHIEFMVRRARS